ncbi:MAG: hypothetical protein WD801_02090 [Gemmatimonadaceae bacterium]
MTRRSRIFPIAAAILLSACNAVGSADQMDDAMRRDLEAVQAGTIELAPSGDGSKVVSAIEQTTTAQPRPTAPRPKAPPVSSQVAQSPDLEPTPEPQVAQEAPTSNEPTATRPTNTPRVSPPPPGGYKTVGEVIRNAPFPIKPATTPKPR